VVTKSLRAFAWLTMREGDDFSLHFKHVRE
jgi:hypothetical protein